MTHLPAFTEDVMVAGQAMQLRGLSGSDTKALLTLHQEVFGSNVQAPWFDWKYHQGGGLGVGLWLGDAMVAFCGGLPRSFGLNGKWQDFLQIGDVMVRPDWRGVLTRHGPFFHVSRALYARAIGLNKRYSAGFGFPSARHLQLARHLGLLQHVGEMHELQWQLGSAPQDHWALAWRYGAWSCRKLDPMADGFDAVINRCWQSMTNDLPQVLLGVRDAAYVRWRYPSRPDAAHVFLLIQRPWSSRALGLAVLSKPSPGQSVRWLDWIGGPAGFEVAAHMCWQIARKEGASEMVTWTSSLVADHLKHLASSHRVITPIGAPCVSIFPVPNETLPWWFMSGDTDFL